jgi:hypothetical protein
VRNARAKRTHEPWEHPSILEGADDQRDSRRPDPDGDRAVVTFDGKFLDHRW